MIENVAIIVIAITIHYVAEQINEYPDYDCPPYCDVDHNHIKDDKEIEEVPRQKMKKKKNPAQKLRDYQRKKYGKKNK